MFKLSIFPDPIDANCQLTSDDGWNASGYPDVVKGRPCQSFDIPADAPNGHGSTLLITHQAKTKLLQRAILFLRVPNFPYPWDGAQSAALAADDFYLQDSSNFPTNPPPRLEVLQMNIHFRGGLFFHSSTYGNMPWWPSALAWCDKNTRLKAYEQAKLVGDTHQILNIPMGKPLYDEANNFYNPSRFPALDWTNGLTRLDNRFSDLVDEIIESGFKVFITMQEEYVYSIQMIRLVMEALSDRQVPWCVTMPGYDGVFYGWEPSNTLIPGWANLARSIKPNCILGLEFNPGHIPLGNGPSDYAVGGLMDGYDMILGEFPSVPPDLNNPDDCNNVWQVLERMIRPYIPDPNQPKSVAPFYLTDSPRGPRTFIAFETWEPYNWVRINPNDPSEVNEALIRVQAERDYFRARGCQWIG